MFEKMSLEDAKKKIKMCGCKEKSKSTTNFSGSTSQSTQDHQPKYEVHPQSQSDYISDQHT
jgi:hypothetical protein